MGGFVTSQQMPHSASIAMVAGMSVNFGETPDAIRE
jgi:hypothetical protein